MTAILLGCHTPALCNDTANGMPIGGLVFAGASGISVESEELRIRLDGVNVRYQLANRSDKPLTLSMVFPLPDIDLSEPENVALPASDPLNFVGLDAKIDGRPAKFIFEQRAWIGDKDVSSQLAQLQFPMLPVGPREVRIADLPAATRDRLVSSGLLTTIGTGEGGRPIYGFAWIVKTSAARQQTFPADSKPVMVELGYKPVIGVATDTILRKSLRQNKDMASEIARLGQDYCTTDALYAEVDMLAAKGRVQERRLNYVLNSPPGAGAIKSFKLSVDAGGKDRLVSLCGAGLKPVPNRPLEFGASNFTPASDLKVLMLGKF